MLLDSHTHITTGRSIDNVFAHLALYGEGRSVVLPIQAGDCTGVGPGNADWRTELTVEAFERHPDKVIPFCHVNPLARDAMDQLRAHHATGIFRGFGEHKVRIACDHPASMQIYRFCGEVGWPVLMHFDYQDFHNYNIEAFDKVLEACPDTSFIGHAQSWWANISAEVVCDYTLPEFVEYPQGPIVLGGLVDLWLEKYPNLYTDLSARSAYFALSRELEFTAGFLTRHRAKLIWGSDCPCLNGKGDLVNGNHRDCLSDLMLPLLREHCDDDHYEDLTHRNAERLLGL